VTIERENNRPSFHLLSSKTAQQMAFTAFGMKCNLRSKIPLEHGITEK
jgi:hypothetical protein